MARTIISAVLCLFSLGFIGQQSWLYNTHQFNTFDINHAFAGQYDDASFALRYRSQWLRFEGAPQTGMLSLHAPFSNSVAAGLQLKSDKIGLHEWTQVKVAIAYHLDVNKSTLAFALTPGFLSARFDQNGIRTIHDESFNFDPVPWSGITFDFSALFWSENLLVGAQISNLNTPSATYVDVNNFLERHVDILAAYTYLVGESHAIKPIVVTRFVPGGKASIDASAQFFWRQTMWLGAGWRSGNTIFGLLEFEITDNLRAGYSFDFFTDDRLPSSMGTHEVFLGFNFALSKSQAQSIRYFK